MKPERLDEASLRRADFVPGTAVTLADGQSWQLRRPVVRFVPDDSQDCGFEVVLTLAGNDEFAALVKRWKDAFSGSESASISDIVGPELVLAKLVLLANYDLAPPQVSTLIQFGYDGEADPDGAELRDAVMDVVLGRGPKS